MCTLLLDGISYVNSDDTDFPRIGAIQRQRWCDHVGDFCAALGVAPGREYQRDGGPTLRQCFELLHQATCPARPQLLRFLDYVIFNALIGNDEAHAGSYSLLYFDAGAVLAPLHGARPTAVYPVPISGMAMKIGGKYGFGELQAQDWEQFAHEIGLEPERVRERLLEMAHSLPAAAHRLHMHRDHLFADNALIARLVALIAQRCDSTLRCLAA